MPGRALYLGDDELSTAAAYLAGLLHRDGFDVDHVASSAVVSKTAFEASPALVILSDYPANRLSAEACDALLRAVERGAGLLTIGGWESYSGVGGDWDRTALAAFLPVAMLGADDRVNCDSPCLAEPVALHPLVEGFPWFARPPLVGGYNRVTPKAYATVVLRAARYDVVVGSRGERTLRPRADVGDPLLVVRERVDDGGRVACLTTDVAPHWIGPWVDWGDERVAAQAPGGAAVEVGSLYAEFVTRLCRWTARER